ncbi:MAG: hypothetical protein GY866_21570 [Proteobacteria bacterium]|nr:hypothetical protein [Pseudomonadota bacterium]
MGRKRKQLNKEKAKKKKRLESVKLLTPEERLRKFGQAIQRSPDAANALKAALLKTMDKDDQAE